MIDRHILPLQHRLLEPLAARLAAQGAGADALSVTGFGLGLAAAGMIALGWPLAGLLGILANRLLDGLDGAVARIVGPTDRGAFLDIALDFLFYALVPLGFALANPAQNALAATVLTVSFVGTGSSFLAFATLAGQRGITMPAYPNKGIAYLGGLTEGAETIAVFVAMCLWPRAFPPLAYGFAALCFLTTVLRWRWGWQALGEPSRGD